MTPASLRLWIGVALAGLLAGAVLIGGGCEPTETGLPLDYQRVDASDGGEDAPPSDVVDLPPRAVPLPPSPGLVDCGDMSCGDATPICCLGNEISCRSRDNCQAPKQACDSAEDCPDGVICCASLKSLKSTCQASTDCTSWDDFILCKEDAHCDDQRPYCCPVVIDHTTIVFACSAVRC